MVRVGFSRINIDPITYAAVVCLSNKEDDDLRKAICDGVPAQGLGGQLVVEILPSKTYGFCWYTRDFTEIMPEYFIRNEPETIFLVEQLRLTYGGTYPLGPWSASRVKSRGPVEMTGKAIGVSSSDNISLTDTFKLLHMPMQTQYWQLKQLRELAKMGIEGPLRLSMINNITINCDDSGDSPIRSQTTMIKFGVTKSRHVTNKGALPTPSQETATEVPSSTTVPSGKTRQEATDPDSTTAQDKTNDTMYKLDSRWFCANCQYSSNNKSNINKHVKIHTGKKNYTCQICAKKFSDKSNYNTHVDRHRKIGKHQCPHCGKHFMAHNNLNAHIKAHELDKQIYSGKCGLSYCKQFGVKFKDLLCHLRKAHKIFSLKTYTSYLMKDFTFTAVSEKSDCDCPEHGVWIYRWVGKGHNCYLCECKLVFRDHVMINGRCTPIRLCKYRRCKSQQSLLDNKLAIFS